MANAPMFALLLPVMMVWRVAALSLGFEHNTEMRLAGARHLDNIPCAAPEALKPEISLMTRSFYQRGDPLLASLKVNLRTLAFSGVELVYVLDSESTEDLKLGSNICKAVASACTTESAGCPRVRVVYEPLPLNHKEMFLGRLEGGPGKDRSQYSNFIMDSYTNVSIIGFFDAEETFTAPVIPAYVKASGRLHNVVQMYFPSGDYWGVDAWALDLSTPLEAMWHNRFPILFWARDLASVRDHLVRRFFGSDSPDVGKFASSFDAAFAKITGAEPRLGYQYVGKTRNVSRHGYSQFNIMMNYMLHERPSYYSFHGIPGFADGMQALKQSSPLAELTQEPHMSFGHNGRSSYCGRWAELPWAATMCCKMFPSLACTFPEPYRQPLGSPDVAATVSKHDYNMVCGPWGPPASDVCLEKYLDVARAHFSHGPQSQHLQTCRSIVGDVSAQHNTFRSGWKDECLETNPHPCPDGCRWTEERLAGKPSCDTLPGYSGYCQQF